MVVEKLKVDFDVPATIVAAGVTPSPYLGNSNRYFSRRLIAAIAVAPVNTEPRRPGH